MALEIYVLLMGEGDRHGPAFADADFWGPSSAQPALDRAVSTCGDAPITSDCVLAAQRRDLVRSITECRENVGGIGAKCRRGPGRRGIAAL